MRKMFSKYGILDNKMMHRAQFKFFNLWDNKKPGSNIADSLSYDMGVNDSWNLSESGKVR